MALIESFARRLQLVMGRDDVRLVSCDDPRCDCMKLKVGDTTMNTAVRPEALVALEKYYGPAGLDAAAEGVVRQYRLTVRVDGGESLLGALASEGMKNNPVLEKSLELPVSF